MQHHPVIRFLAQAPGRHEKQLHDAVEEHCASGLDDATSTVDSALLAHQGTIRHALHGGPACNVRIDMGGVHVVIEFPARDRVQALAEWRESMIAALAEKP